MKHYDPDVPPEPAEWLLLDEQQRIRLVEAHHRSTRVKLPNAKAHAIFHVIVENQIAEQLAPVVDAMARLEAEGLSRHDALHAIGSLVADHVFAVVHGMDEASASTAQARYEAAVERLTAREWRRKYGVSPSGTRGKRRL